MKWTGLVCATMERLMFAPGNMKHLDSTSPRTPEASRAEYALRVNRVIDYIERNLAHPLSLAALADVAHFSRFHFHRIFATFVGERPNEFIQRLRLEKASSLLATQPNRSITEIAFDCGFGSSATFARAFKEATGMSASQWRAQVHSGACETNSKIGILLSNPGKASSLGAIYRDPETGNATWRYEMKAIERGLDVTITVKELPEYNVAYVRYVGPYGQTALVPRLFGKLHGWAGPRGLIGPDTVHLLVAHDNPKITSESKLRLSACMTVPDGIRPEGEVGTMKIPGGKFAVGHFEIAPDQVGEAWSTVIGEWMPQSGFQPDDRLSYEVPLNNPAEHPQGKIIMNVCVPVRPL